MSERPAVEQRVYLPDLGLVVILGPGAQVRRGFVATTLRIRAIELRETCVRTHVRVRRVERPETNR